jgi:cytochrome d ubiquinol oxidase subunit II
MTVVAVIFFPLVLIYQGWSFHVFRGRLKAAQAQPDSPFRTSPAGSASPQTQAGG